VQYAGFFCLKVNSDNDVRMSALSKFMKGSTVATSWRALMALSPTIPDPRICLEIAQRLLNRKIRAVAMWLFKTLNVNYRHNICTALPFTVSDSKLNGAKVKSRSSSTLKSSIKHVDS
jgi:hypothetical protein